VAPLADALCDVVHDDPERALDTLLALGGNSALVPFGGSAAQREIVEETLIDCAISGGRPEVAADVLSRRIERRNSPADRHRRDRLVRAAATLPACVAPDVPASVAAKPVAQRPGVDLRAPMG
jgi:hypothetical protein